MTAYPPTDPKKWPATLAEMRGGFAEKLNIYKVMAHHSDLLRSWKDLRAHIVTDNALGVERLEICILRAAHRLGSSYEWDHHVSRSRAIDLTDDRIFAMAGPPDEMDPEDAIIAGAVDALLDAAELDATTHSALSDLVGTEGVFDLIATVGFYQTLGYIAKSFDVPLDDGIEAHGPGPVSRTAD
jgi:alkylhydroperoxidase family enzyme